MIAKINQLLHLQTTPTFVNEGDSSDTTITITANLDKPSGQTVTAKYSTDNNIGNTTGVAIGTSGPNRVQDFSGIVTPKTFSFTPW